MRDILFRGKRVDNGKWVIGFLVYKDENDAYISAGDYTTFSDGFFQVYNAIAVIPETVGQYTGLTDKNGKKVFDGDIVKCTEVTDTLCETYISTVDYDDCDLVVHSSPMCDMSLSAFFGDCINPLTEIEVIGNVWDNPELLKRE